MKRWRWRSWIKNKMQRELPRVRRWGRGGEGGGSTFLPLELDFFFTYLYQKVSNATEKTKKKRNEKENKLKICSNSWTHGQQKKCVDCGWCLAVRLQKHTRTHRTSRRIILWYGFCSICVGQLATIEFYRCCCRFPCSMGVCVRVHEPIQCMMHPHTDQNIQLVSCSTLSLTLSPLPPYG